MQPQHKLNRRTFLKLALVGGLSLGLSSAFPVSAAPLETSVIPIPPSLMLHSRHHKQFPELLDYLVNRGYEGITYDTFYRAALGELALPARPFLLSIDDLSMTKGNPAFKVFRKMKNTLDHYNFKATFGIITRPDVPQDDDLWAEVSAWGGDGYGLESHTSYHSNLNDPSWIEQDYQAEIVDSARVIRLRTGQPVRALITPFGSGYDTEHGVLNPMVADACRKAKIPFVAGIVGGRESIQLPFIQQEVYYCGRCSMGIDDTNAGGIFEIEHWYAR